MSEITHTPIEASPVLGEIEAVAWRNKHGAITNFERGAEKWRAIGHELEPLYGTVAISTLQSQVQALQGEVDKLTKERDANARLDVGSPEWHEDLNNNTEFSQWGCGIVEPSLARQRELISWATHRLFADGWHYAKLWGKERRRAEAAEAQVQSLTEALKLLRNAGSPMANICFNLFQMPEGHMLTGRDAQSMNTARLAWDEALDAARSLQSGGAEHA